MKPDKKVHIIAGHDPVSPQQPLEMPCGKVLRVPRQAFLFDEACMGQRLDFGPNTMLLCKKCMASYLGAATISGLTFIYGFCEGAA